MSIRIDGTNTAANPGITGADTDTGLQFGTDEVSIVTGGSTRATVDSSGDLTLANDSTLIINNPDGTRTLSLFNDANNAEINASNDPLRLHANHSSGYIRFDTGGANERMRISDAGDVRIGTTANNGNGKIEVFFDTSRNGIHLRPSSSTLNQNYLIFTNSDGSTTGFINQNGTTSVGYNTSSDYRLKENVVDLDGAIARVKQLAPKRFNFISEADRTVDGFLAHEAQAVVPEAITGTHNGVQLWKEGEELPEGVSVGDNKLDEDGNTIPDYQGIDQSKLVPLLTAALQEAIGKIETLESQHADLLARVTALEATE
jgi:hypothetical protein|tara:strand:- start:1557 stop:2504 length:948 start_codon:yes stop_codon:yes gene_type:complete